VLGVDTNVIVRLVVSDDAAQTRRGRYGFDREALLNIFRSLLEARELTFEDEPAMEEASRMPGAAGVAT
jgi:predicted nucleic-acid-binding protein